MRLIDADALMKTLGITEMDCERCEWGEHGFCRRGSDFTDACAAIEDAPTIEPERKRGKWDTVIITIACGHKYGYYACSSCGIASDSEFNFCPNCGADMREE